MNGNDQHLGDELGQHLRHRVDGLHDAPLTLRDVQGRARTIRRNRWVAGAASVAAAVAIIVPVTIFAGQGLDRSDAPNPGPATSSPSGTPSRASDNDTEESTPEPNPTGGTYDLGQDASRGADAAIAHLDREALVWPDGSRVDLPQEYDQFVLVGNEVVAARSDDDGNRSLDVLDSSGAVSLTVPDVAGLAGNAQGTIAAWSTTDGELFTYVGGGTPASLGDQQGAASPVAVLGDGTCEAGAGSCDVYFNQEFEEPPMVAHEDGTTEQVVGSGALVVNDVDLQGRAAIRISASDTGSCSGVYDPEKQRYFWKTCDYSLSRFSPDGRYVLALPAYLDGLGPNEVSVLDATTGDLAAKYQIDRGFIGAQTWEDDTHPLVVTYDDHGWRLLRLGLGGVAEQAADPVTDRNEMARPFSLPGSP